MSKKYEVTAMAYNKRGRLLVVGKNSYVRSHPLQAHFGKLTGKPKAIYLHAELHAILTSREPVYELKVYRFDNEGKPALSKPCAACQLAIKHFGVKKVTHT